MYANEVKQCLIQKGADSLYHVNSVVTALTYINNGGLLSRGTVDDWGLEQTKQITDNSDKELDIYYDIFFDSVDIHKRAKSLNKYGAVTFVFSLDVLDELEEYEILITKDNPKRWTTDMEVTEKYFTSSSEIINEFWVGNFSQHITVIKPIRPISFDFLEYIIIDSPLNPDDPVFNDALIAINNALSQNGYENIKILIRKCPPDCKCKTEYANHRPGYTYHRFKTKL